MTQRAVVLCARTPPGFGGVRMLGTPGVQSYGLAYPPPGLDWEVVQVPGGVIPEPAGLWNQSVFASVLDFPNVIRSAWIYHLDGHIYARAQGGADGAGDLFVIRITEPGGFLTINRDWMVAQGWGDALAALQRIRPSVGAALPAKRAAFVRESLRLDEVEFWRRVDASVEDAWDVMEWLNNVPSRLAQGASDMAQDARNTLKQAGLIVLGVSLLAAVPALIYAYSNRGGRRRRRAR